MRVRPRILASALVLIFATLGFASVSLGQVTLHVDPNATDTPHDGSSWCRAYIDLQDALAAAFPGDEVLVAAGTYKPTTGTNRIKTFQLINGVSILGGFAGCGAVDPDLRDFNAHPSILSGDLLGDDDPTPTSSCCADNGTQTCDDAVCAADVCAERPSCCSDVWDEICGAVARVVCCSTCGNRCENSYHVVTGSGADATAVLDGFTITQGHADGNNPSDRGAGVFTFFVASSPIIRNCIIRGNTAIAKGAGMYDDLSGITLENCLFTHNAAPNGAAIFNFRSAPLIRNCTISENIAFVNQGGVRNATNDSPTIYNSILWGNLDNSGRDEPAQLNVGSGTTLTLSYSCLQGLTGLYGGTGNTGEDPLFADTDGVDNLPGTPDDDFRLLSASPMIEAGDPGFVAPVGAIDLDGQSRLQGCSVDIGAYEFPVQGSDCDSDGDGTLDSQDACPNNPHFAADQGPCSCSSADADGDGAFDCVDGCPDDPNKVDPGACGCGVDDHADADGDGVADCIDQCSGVDDAVFAPDCVGAIPTISEWGLVILALLLLVAGKVYFGRGAVMA